MTFGQLRALVAAALIGPSLTACGIFGGQVSMDIPREASQVCPAVGIVGRTGSLTRFATSDSRDIGDVTLRGTISGLEVICEDISGAVRASIGFDVIAQKGPASRDDDVDLSYFIVVTRGSDEVLDKRLYVTRHSFSPGRDSSALRENIVADVPVDDEGSTGEIEILIGFQLDRDELKYNVFH